jgi:hypothetical protein
MHPARKRELRAGPRGAAHELREAFNMLRASPRGGRAYWGHMTQIHSLMQLGPTDWRPIYDRSKPPKAGMDPQQHAEAVARWKELDFQVRFGR